MTRQTYLTVSKRKGKKQKKLKEKERKNLVT